MRRLPSKRISTNTQAHLQATQNAVNSEPTFAERAQKAGSLWDSKSSSTAGRQAFTEVKTTLTEMCVGIEICNYCEANEATDIEHIFPKKMFPERAFQWGNYILACKICNTTYKSDNFQIFNPQGSSTKQDAKPPRGSYIQPPTSDAVLINPRNENPQDFMRIDLIGQTFLFVPIESNQNTREYLKAKYTIDLLGLNTRNALVEARKASAKEFRNMLKQYLEIKNATNHTELERAIGDFPAVNHSTPFNKEQVRLLKNIKKAIIEHRHPTVWDELKRQRNHLPNTKRLFEQAPEALDW